MRIFYLVYKGRIGQSVADEFEEKGEGKVRGGPRG